MPIFQNLDLLFGFVSLMLAAGTVVATATQAVATLTRMRSRFLRRSLEELLCHLDPARISPKDARTLAWLLLHHPWLCGGTNAGVSALHREDFVRLLLQLAAGESPAAVRLRNSFGFAGAREVIQLSQTIGSEALRLEMENPREPAREREIKAIIHALGPHPLLAHIQAWYGSAMGRATRRYTLQTHGIAALLALALVLAAQIDLLELFRLHTSCHWAGLTLSWLLITLGTPFWYDRLKDLLHFRPSAS